MKDQSNVRKPFRSHRFFKACPVYFLCDSGQVNSKTLNDEELLDEAKKKLLKEAQELQAADTEELIGELSDIQKLIDLVCKLKGISVTELNSVRDRKAEKTGSFTQKIYEEPQMLGTLL